MLLRLVVDARERARQAAAGPLRRVPRGAARVAERPRLEPAHEQQPLPAGDGPRALGLRRPHGSDPAGAAPSLVPGGRLGDAALPQVARPVPALRAPDPTRGLGREVVVVRAALRGGRAGFTRSAASRRSSADRRAASPRRPCSRRSAAPTWRRSPCRRRSASGSRPKRPTRRAEARLERRAGSGPAAAEVAGPRAQVALRAAQAQLDRMPARRRIPAPARSGARSGSSSPRRWPRRPAAADPETPPSRSGPPSSRPSDAARRTCSSSGGDVGTRLPLGKGAGCGGGSSGRSPTAWITAFERCAAAFTCRSSSQLRLSSPSVKITTSERACGGSRPSAAWRPSQSDVAPRARQAASARLTASRSCVGRASQRTSWEKATMPISSAGRRPSRKASLARRSAASFAPSTLLLVSKARSAVSGSVSTATSSTGRTAPSSRSSKADAVRPVTGWPPLVTKTSTYTASTPVPNVSGGGVCCARPGALTDSASSKCGRARALMAPWPRSGAPRRAGPLAARRRTGSSRRDRRGSAEPSGRAPGPGSPALPPESPAIRRR